MGEWNDSARRALNSLDVSINPMELFSFAFAVRLGIQSGIIKSGMRIVWHNDNDAAIVDWNRQRARSSTMLAALKIVQEVTRKYKVEVFARHIPGRRNIIADALSRRDKATARILAGLILST